MLHKKKQIKTTSYTNISASMCRVYSVKVMISATAVHNIQGGYIIIYYFV